MKTTSVPVLAVAAAWRQSHCNTSNKRIVYKTQFTILAISVVIVVRKSVYILIFLFLQQLQHYLYTFDASLVFVKC